MSYFSTFLTFEGNICTSALGRTLSFTEILYKKFL